MIEIVREAVRNVVKEHGQPKKVGDLILAWLETAPRHSTENDEADAFRRVREIQDALIPDESEEYE